MIKTPEATVPFETIVFTFLELPSKIRRGQCCIAAILDAFLFDLLAAHLFTILVGGILRGRRRIAHDVHGDSHDNGHTGGEDQNRDQVDGCP